MENPCLPLDNLKRKGSLGLALVLVSGLLALLTVAAVGLSALTGRLRGAVSLQTDRAAARLLARSGIEYAAARLYQDSVPRFPPNPVNQADDWTFRDDPDTPLEKALNPSYAQTEPYQDLYPAGAGNGRYDGNLDAYTDLDGNGRFDAASGRLRGPHGAAGGAFLLKISGEGSEGGINVNSGWMGIGDADVNGRQDFQDLKGGAGRNAKLAYALQQLGTLVGVADPVPNSEMAINANQRTSKVGRVIVEGRPPGGYRDARELEKLFAPDEWKLLRPHVSLAGRRNRYAEHTPYMKCLDPDAVRLEPDARYLVNVQAARPETLAALWIGIGEAEQPAHSFRPDAADRLARFLKDYAFISWQRLAADLWKNATVLFANPFMGTYDTQGKALWTLALAKPELHAVGFEGPLCRGFACYDFETTIRRHEMTNQEEWADLFWRGIMPTDAPTGSIELGFTPLSVFSIESAGRAGGAGQSAAWHRASAFLTAEGSIQAWSQSDFENRTGRSGFDGGWILDRPECDRTVTWPCFSRDACPDLDRPPRVEDAQPYELGFNRFFGEVRLLDRSWIEPTAAFYQPSWDLHQPLRPAPEAGEPSLARNFDDVMRGARWVGQDDPETQRAFKRAMLLTGPSFHRNVWPIWAAGPAAWGRTFAWEAAPDAAKFPLVGTGGDGEGTVAHGTLEAWSHVSEYWWHIPPWEPFWGEFRTDQNGTNWWCVQASPYSWKQIDPPAWPLKPPKHEWHASDEPGGAQTSGLIHHFACVFDGDRVDIYRDGIWRGWTHYSPVPENATQPEILSLGGVDESRLYPAPLPAEKIGAHALAGMFWTRDPGFPNIPSFTSPLYRFERPTACFGHAGWDGFVPRILAQAFDDSGGPSDPESVPLRVELLLFTDAEARGVARIVPFPAESWRSGGCRTDVRTLWHAAFPGEPLPRIFALRYRVWMDSSSLGRAWESPVFDGLEIGFRGRFLQRLREE